MQPILLQLPQAGVHSILCFLHEHLSVLQSVWSPVANVQDQEVAMFEVAQTPLRTLVIPSLWDKVLQLILSSLELEGTCEECSTLMLLKLVVRIVVLSGMF